MIRPPLYLYKKARDEKGAFIKATEMRLVTHKECRGCWNTLPVDSFYENTGTYRGKPYRYLRHLCKRCFGAKVKSRQMRYTVNSIKKERMK